MVYRDGLKGEDFFEEFCKQNNLDVKKVLHPFDFLVNGKLVEVKSAKLFTNQSKTGKKVHGRYEYWDESQIKRLKKMNVWVCFIVTTENGCLIQGFQEGKNLPVSLRYSLSKIEQVGLKTTKQFLRYING